jgi:hypothetical protein
MKIHIFYRHYNIEGTDYKNRPQWFDFEKCFVNLLDTIKDKNVDLHVVMDGNVENNFIKKYQDRYILHTINAKADQISFWETWKIAKETLIGEKDLIYFLENDYLHVENWVEKIISLFSSYEGLCYVSLYDHNDKYFPQHIDDSISKIYTTSDHHWRTITSTCGSFVVNKNIFEEDYTENTTIAGDHNKFVFLAQTKNRFVMTPIPGLSTHCMNGLMSPTIDWEQINNITLNS